MSPMPEVHGILILLQSGRWEPHTRLNSSSARLRNNRAERIIECHREVEVVRKYGKVRECKEPDNKETRPGGGDT